MKRIISLLLTAVLLLALMPAALAYSDVPKGAWYEYSAKYCKSMGIMQGTSEDEFSPDANMTRGMFVTALFRMSRGVVWHSNMDAETSNFKDVPDTMWCVDGVKWASSRGITLGVTEELFCPNAYITREQIACMIARYAEHIKANFPTEPELMERYKDVSFLDADSVSDFAKDGVELVRKTGIMRGDKNGNFRPHDYVTRAEAAAIFERLDLTVCIYDVWTSGDYLVATEEQKAQLVSLMSGMEKGEYAEYLCEYYLWVEDTNFITYSFKINDPTHVNVSETTKTGESIYYGLDDPTGEIAAQIWAILNTLEIEGIEHW
ncbi:MAG: S-layer homology domain-containing protein [Bacillota bacterium]|nr:S-layer homology domain-containing protein [Bacillota bacterium]